MKPWFWTVSRLARHLGVSRIAVHDRLGRGTLPRPLRVGKVYLWPARWLTELQVPQPDPPEPGDLWSTTEVVSRLGVGRRTLRRLISGVPRWRVGRAIVYRASDLWSWYLNLEEEVKHG